MRRVVGGHRQRRDIFADYAAEWLQGREVSERVLDSYRRLLKNILIPAFGNAALRDIDSAAVHAWYAATGPDMPTVRVHAYSLLRSIMRSAVAENLIDADPCQKTGISTSHTAEAVRPATAGEIAAIAEGMPEPYQALVLMAGWLAMPTSELSELRRNDVDTAAKVVRVRRAVEWVNGSFRVTTPKAREGIRDVAIPPHLFPVIDDHLRHHVQRGAASLLFPSVRDPGRYLNPAVLNRMFARARIAAGRADLRLSDVRRSRPTLRQQPCTGA